MTDMPMPPGGAVPGSGGPTPQGGEETVRLAALRTHLLDTLQGFDKVVEKAEPEFQGVASDFLALHKTQAERVAQLLLALGHDPHDTGSLHGTVNRAAVEIRSWFDDIGHNILGSIAEGERALLDSFDAAIVASPSPERRGVLQQMRTELETLLQRHAPDHG